MTVTVSDRIQHEVLVEAPPERVWSVITEAPHVGVWFGDAAEIDLRPGGEMILRWTEHGLFHARIEKVEPPRLFSFRWARPADAQPAEGNATLVEFSLIPEGPHTRLRVVETGFRDLDVPKQEQAKYAEGNQEGWERELEDLRSYAAEPANLSR
jgi:uncharacterized protein YndB with AHSA1/START domain